MTNTDPFDDNFIIPDLSEVPEDDTAEPEDADVKHLASASEVEAAE